MNCNQNTGCSVRMPGIAKPPYPPGNSPIDGRYPIGMGYVPWQIWETPYPVEQGFQRGTLFQSLDYPFVMGRCRR